MQYAKAWSVPQPTSIRATEDSPGVQLSSPKRSPALRTWLRASTTAPQHQGKPVNTRTKSRSQTHRGMALRAVSPPLLAGVWGRMDIHDAAYATSSAMHGEHHGTCLCPLFGKKIAAHVRFGFIDSTGLVYLLSRPIRRRRSSNPTSSLPAPRGWPWTWVRWQIAAPLARCSTGL
jgi:hypothetical protein